ncbi:restriction endonuclease subunit S [Limosilactobacillus reuteri]|uniref:restriction endonuclease subunit S n=1 Tax=Limosilactobacillus reuteri TaxID=1598 RepID=UPI002B0522C0|nr:restriction endonuclease subunit S [Limosilactobacillus reuteri]
MVNDNLATLKTSIFDKLFKNKMSSHLNGNLSNITIITSGKRPKKKFDNKSSVAKYPIVGASKIMGYTDRYLYNESILTTGRVGTHGVIQRFRKPVWVSDNSFVFKTEHEDYLFEILNNWIKYSALNRGSTQPLITQTDLKNIDIYVPTKEEFYHFESVVTPLTDQQFSLISENDNLKKAKAALLSKLF